jgi:hypothetical protein
MTLQEQSNELRRLSTELTDFKCVYKKRTMQDSYRFAELAEVDEFKTNTANSNRVMIVGRISSVVKISNYF